MLSALPAEEQIPRVSWLCVIPSADLWPLDDAVHLSASKSASDNSCSVLGMLQRGRSAVKTTNYVLSCEEMRVKRGGCESATLEWP